MRIKLLVSAAAIALVAGLGTATAAERFTYLTKVQAEPLTTHELSTIRGGHFVHIHPPGISPYIQIFGHDTPQFPGIQASAGRSPIIECHGC